MILRELFNAKDDIGHVVKLSEEFHAFKRIGGREIRFSAEHYRGIWELTFSEVEGEGYQSRTKFDMTGKGYEVEVMSFVMECVRRVIKEYDPNKLKFSSKTKEKSRTSLYRRMISRFAKDYEVEEKLDGDQFIDFYLIRKGSTLAESKITIPQGFIEFDWKKDLQDEEDEDYLPAGYSYDKVIELKNIGVKEPGKGHGSMLMKKFIAKAKSMGAELIFADPMPGMGENFESGMSAEQQIASIKNFNRKFGFRSNDKSNRDWLVLKGSIPDDQLPS